MHTCPLCSSTTTMQIGVLTGSRTGVTAPLYACRNCFTLFQKQSYHEDDRALKADLQWHINKTQACELESRQMVEKLLEIAPDAKTLLDIGCGIGSTLIEGNKLGLTCAGVEPNSFACEYAKEHYNFDIIADYFRPEQFQDKFDLIILDQVLEHVPHPQEFLNDVFSVLKPSGLLYLGVPGNKGGIVKVIFSLLFQKNKRSIFSDNDVHINHFFHKGFVHLSQANNVRIVQKVTDGVYILQKDPVLPAVTAV